MTHYLQHFTARVTRHGANDTVRVAQYDCKRAVELALRLPGVSEVHAIRNEAWPESMPWENV